MKVCNKCHPLLATVGDALKRPTQFIRNGGSAPGGLEAESSEFSKMCFQFGDQRFSPQHTCDYFFRAPQLLCMPHGQRWGCLALSALELHPEPGAQQGPGDIAE